MSRETRPRYSLQVVRRNPLGSSAEFREVLRSDFASPRDVDARCWTSNETRTSPIVAAESRESRRASKKYTRIWDEHGDWRRERSGSGKDGLMEGAGSYRFSLSSLFSRGCGG